ncbi:MAG: glycoside hydrolase family 43 protein [Acholeplasmataceae bacterium]|nr:glycoside hydrolase family 43 protein [Acholeplasmataceae bacterium]
MNIKNPIGITNIGDPFVIKHLDIYYLYATSFIAGFYCWTSQDLIHWDGPKQVYRQSERSFGYRDFWAPEVVYHHGSFIMHYSARSIEKNSLRIGVAVSKNPLGPFVDVYDQKPMFDFGFAAIDGHVFIDDDGERYFYFDKDCSEHVINGIHESHIYVAKLDDTLTKIKSDIRCVMKPEQTWETKSGAWRWNEGPFVLKNKDVYYLMYSAGFYASKDYAIGYATSKNPMGPFIKAEENPILSFLENKISGPGHNSVIQGPDLKMYCVYHVHTNYLIPSENRQVFIDEIRIKNGKLLILGPTLGYNDK